MTGSELEELRQPCKVVAMDHLNGKPLITISLLICDIVYTGFSCQTTLMTGMY